MKESAPRTRVIGSPIRRVISAAIVALVGVSFGAGGVSHAADVPVYIPPPHPHLNACFPEPALPSAPYLGPAVEGALTYDDWLATVVANLQGCDSLRMPVFGELRMPLTDAIASSMFGSRYHPVRRRWLPHTGVDLVDRERSWRAPVLTAGAGTIAATGSFPAYGRSVIIDHGQRVATVYTHLSSVAVTEGQQVAAGTKIGRVGATGAATGPHLHFELRLGGAAVNPLDYVAPWAEPPDGHP